MATNQAPGSSPPATQSSSPAPDQTPAGATKTPPPVATPGSQPVPATREEQIALERRQKHATLWPERESPLVRRANRLVDRGFVEGIETGQGHNGWQFLLAGTRPNQGQTFGIGYRRSDLFQDALSVRGTVRGTLSGALLVDGDVQLNRFRRSTGTFLDAYAKYERSPRMEFYGVGANSSEADRTGYLLSTSHFEVASGYRFTRQLNGGLNVGYGKAHTASATRDDIPSIETKFDATTAPGLFDDTPFLFLGAFAGLDTRDHPRGPRRGGFYGISYNRFLDQDEGQYTHRRLEFHGQQFFPYFNATKVIALFVKARFAFTEHDDQAVPFYLLPTLGGSYDLRGYGNFRFTDNNSIIATVEHRWYAFSALEMALFVDTGTTTPTKGHINTDDLNYSGGLGVRVRLGGAIVLRTDVAKSSEGWRVIWSLSDVSRRRF
jgi:outer membrane protein assembly factor BamA